MAKLIVIEGLDGSGKATQTELLAQWLSKSESVLKITFPDYESDSSTLVRMYLSGKIGGINDVNAYAASTFYAADRYISFQNNWKIPYNSGHTILCDRYTTSNAAHQMSKLPKEEWDNYLDWLLDYEFIKLELPKPTQVIYLDMSPSTSRLLIESRNCGNSTKMDIHEKDLDYLFKCRQAALYAAKKLSWNIIKCDDNNLLLSKEAVFELIKQNI